LNISGTAQLFDDNLDSSLFMVDTFNNTDELLCFIEEDRKIIRQLREQQKSDFNEVCDLIEKYKTGQLDSPCGTEANIHIPPTHNLNNSPHISSFCVK
jgi:hypothetical protein